MDRSNKDGPVTELTSILQRIEDRIAEARESYRESCIPPPAAPLPDSTSPVRRFGRFLSRSNDGATPKTPTKRTLSSPNPSPLRPEDAKFLKEGPLADFIPFPNQDEFIEDLRRAAELCVIGENFVSNIEKKVKLKKEFDKQQWQAARDGLIDELEEQSNQFEGLDQEANDEKVQLFDLFFERNGLVMLVDMLHGESFEFQQDAISSSTTAEEEKTESFDNEIKSDNITMLEKEKKTLLPPLAVATQVLQSISILIQNVSRATSLYMILSNNYINKLMGLPLDLYTAAERRRLIVSNEAKELPRVFSSPQITEVATHFVTFLKSLALRINSETLQFFLKYQMEDMATSVENEIDEYSTPTKSSIRGRTIDQNDDEESDDLVNQDKFSSAEEAIPTIKAEFPLYERALEFCAAHHDSFVRVTALNICMNTLRLTTISATEDDENTQDGEETFSRAELSSPDGVLHNSKPLPFRERLTIAQYACIPSRVNRLIAPIFTKIAERWSALDEHMQMIDSNKHMGASESTDEFGARNERVAMAKDKVKRERLIRGVKDKVADLHDELILLDDVFKVSGGATDAENFPHFY
jgi:hypothetical protein